ncbi:MAG: PrsW family glutamic-type intramembrane protease [Anaerolineae bacterium]|nr:PrsW family glutamic-type intramembrane protease [Anaerolineae bacterium]
MTSRLYLLTPQREDSDRYPYRRVWRTAWLEAVLLLGIATTLVFGMRLTELRLPADLERTLSFAFGLLPLSLWLSISYIAERRALQPRRNLLAVVTLGGLAASGVAVPLTTLFAPEEWLSTASGLNRIVGYTLSVGIVHEFLKYAVLRYSVWRTDFTTRLDAVAYAMAAAVGFATALNIHFALNNTLNLASAALRMTEIALAQIAISPILGFVLYELRKPNVFILTPMLGVLVAALFNALSIVIRAGLIVSNVSRTSTANNAIYGLGMALFLVVVLFSALSFLVRAADEREALRAGEVR